MSKIMNPVFVNRTPYINNIYTINHTMIEDIQLPVFDSQTMQEFDEYYKKKIQDLYYSTTNELTQFNVKRLIYLIDNHYKKIMQKLSKMSFYYNNNNKNIDTYNNHIKPLINAYSRNLREIYDIFSEPYVISQFIPFS